jgi:protein gp37
VKFISFEPLMQEIKLDMMQKMLFPQVINWVIIGGWDRGKTQPKVEWIRGIIEAADRTGIPAFLKDNLLPLLKNHNAYPWAFTPNSVPTFPTYRQEFPKEAQNG